ncbi:hypothetical protein PPACK8108_LOCUS24704 [Phakopsora pachyrhizi]|uniref:Uncharacterized protein n=1 Tax=Phakopsora pachyrhizi TaxID=170000 RepID=A0AAV0BTM2_PHAPC|nr:hypothetical protein PPACK8108_LOCUS24704 [Phakopsora pachyrhizi]
MDRSECSKKSLAKILTQHHPIVKPLNNIKLIEGGLQAYNQETICKLPATNTSYSDLPQGWDQKLHSTSKSAPATLSPGAKYVHFDSHLEHLRPSSNNKNGALLPSPVLMGTDDSVTHGNAVKGTKHSSSNYSQDGSGGGAATVSVTGCTVTRTIPLGSFTLPLPIHSHSDHLHQHSHGLNIPEPVYYTGETRIVAATASDKSNTDGGPLYNGYYSEVARTTKDEVAPGHMV